MTLTAAQKHTPLPWYVREYTNYYGFSIMHTDFGCVAERWEEIYKEDRAKQMAENAAFIVRACNFHYELLTSLENLVNCMEALEALGKVVFSSTQIAKDAKAAIAKATGTP